MSQSGGEQSGEGGGGTMGSLGGPTGPNPADKAKMDALYEDREPKKIIRIITVTAYMVSVSFVGIVLSVYYIFLWHPPNPRLMHSQAMSAHSEALVAHDNDGLLAAARMAPEVRTISLLDAGSETLKMRREIVRNVNAMTRANFEKSRTSETSASLAAEEIAEALLLMVNGTTVSAASTHTLNNTIESPPPSTISSPTTLSSQETNSAPAIEESSTTSTTTIGTPTILPPTRKSRGPAKKQHQTPFALKHLEVPIKSDGSPRRRPVRPTTTTATMRSTVSGSLDTEGTSSDKTTAFVQVTTSASTQSSFDASISSNPVKSLYKTLTTPRDSGDYSSSSTDIPVMPSISSDQFQAVPRDYDTAGVTMVQPDILDD